MPGFTLPPEKPVVIEQFILHHYKDGIETQRVQGVVGRYYEKEWRMEVDGVTAFFYDNAPPYCQSSVLKSDHGILYMADEPTTPPSYRKSDIDFNGHVVFLERESSRKIETDQARYHASSKLLLSETPSDWITPTKTGLMKQHYQVGFTVDMTQSVYTHKGASLKLETLTGDEGKRALAKHNAEFDAIPWVCGPDDIPVSQVKKEGAK